MVPQNDLATCTDTLFVRRPANTEQGYGRVSRLPPGLQALQEIFQGGSSLRNPEVMRYIFGLLYLESRLRRNKRMLDAIGKGLADIEAEHPGPGKAGDPEVIRRLGALYQDTLSTLRFRIQVKGEGEFLQNEMVAARVRATLLAGVRSAVLWYQVGGRRWHLLMHRRRICQDLLLLLSNTHDLVE